MTSIYDKEELSDDDVQNEMFRRMEKYEEKSFLECFSIYLGTAQILEFALKKLLEEKFAISEEETEKLTLGQARAKLESVGLRADYTELLKQVVKDRNHAAHELLANQALISGLGVEFSERMQFKELKHFTFGLEQAVFLFDYFQHNNAWVVNA
ncbi:hypothetical protein [Shewanella sp. KJ2020]|uniref:hypothetical protein n=1 Tax=Shewanella sp. KJ2020 TaxID=2919172 RepID=UPI0020A71F4C|nr:hypothetical protein [Shewanella sp. KJ2020]MCP3127251.1 hypothetical protein [Shewanella sp. KJ2020]